MLWRAHCFDIQAHSTDNFLYVHERYEEPGYVLRNKNVTLFTLERERAVFCVTEPDVDVYDMVRFPFVFYAQYDEARRLALMRTEDFHGLAEELGDPPGTRRVTLLHNTSRCGSTLIGQIVFRLPGIRCLSEPFVLVAAHQLFRRGLVSPEDNRRTVRSCLRMLCKVEPVERDGVEHVFIKCPALISSQLAIVGECFPDVRLIFNTRHPKPCLSSLVRIMSPQQDSSRFVFNLAKKYLGDVLPIPYDSTATSANSQYYYGLNYAENVAYIYCGSVANYLRNRQRYSHVVLYEDLANRPRQEVARLLEAMEVPPEHVDAALKAMDADSQQGRFGGRGHAAEMKEDYWAFVDGAFAKLGMDVRCNFTLEELKKLLTSTNY